MTDKKCCGRCGNWFRLQPSDLTAPEGTCGLKEEPPFWPGGYWPNTLQRDRCNKFKPLENGSASEVRSRESQFKSGGGAKSPSGASLRARPSTGRAGQLD